MYAEGGEGIRGFGGVAGWKGEWYCFRLLVNKRIEYLT